MLASLTCSVVGVGVGSDKGDGGTDFWVGEAEQVQ